MDNLFRHPASPIVTTFFGIGLEMTGSKILGVLIIFASLGWLWYLFLPAVMRYVLFDRNYLLWGGWGIIALACSLYGFFIIFPFTSFPSTQTSSTNQSGGVTGSNNTVIYNLPISNTKPQVKVGKTVQSNVKTAEGYETTTALAIESPYPVGNFRATACGRTITKAKLSPENMSGYMSDGTWIEKGCAFTNVQNAYGTFKLIITSSEPLSSTNQAHIKLNLE